MGSIKFDKKAKIFRVCSVIFKLDSKLSEKSDNARMLLNITQCNWIKETFSQYSAALLLLIALPCRKKFHFETKNFSVFASDIFLFDQACSLQFSLSQIDLLVFA